MKRFRKGIFTLQTGRLQPFGQTILDGVYAHVFVYVTCLFSGDGWHPSCHSLPSP